MPDSRLKTELRCEQENLQSGIRHLELLKNETSRKTELAKEK